MEFRKFGSTYVVRLNKGEEIVETLKVFCKENNIRLGWINGIGAINSATIGLFETEPKKYISTDLKGEFEISSLSGNISTMNGEVYLHIHATVSDVEHKTYGGHLNAAVISATGEVIIGVIDGVVERAFNDEIGLNLMKFE